MLYSFGWPGTRYVDQAQIEFLNFEKPPSGSQEGGSVGRATVTVCTKPWAPLPSIAETHPGGTGLSSHHSGKIEKEVQGHGLLRR